MPKFHALIELEANSADEALEIARQCSYASPRFEVVGGAYATEPTAGGAVRTVFDPKDLELVYEEIDENGTPTNPTQPVSDLVESGTLLSDGCEDLRIENVLLSLDN